MAALDITLQIGIKGWASPDAKIINMSIAQLAGTKEPTSAQQQLASIDPPKIGAVWEGQGGVYAGLMRGANGMPDYHLIVPIDQAASIKEVTWGSRGENEDFSKCPYDGAKNTAALVSSSHSHPAAEWAAGLNIDGHSDFYLPSRFEMALCYANVKELFEAPWHWSSTQCSPCNAWIQHFVDGDQNDTVKGYALRARAVRRFVNHLSI